LRQLTAGDFPQFYIGARLAGTPAEYDIGGVLQDQRQVLGATRPGLMPSRLPFYYMLLRPLSRLPFSSAYTVWLVAMFSAAVSAIVLMTLAEGNAAIAVSLWSAPLFLATCAAQDVGLVYLVLAGGLLLRKCGRCVAAGLVLSLLSIKFNLFLLLPIPFLVKREFRLLGGAAAGLGVLTAISFAGAGQSWPVEYVRLVLNPVVSPGPTVMPNLHGAVSRFSNSALLEALLTVFIAALVFVVARRSQFSIALAAGLFGSILVSRHAYSGDCAVLIPAFLAVFRFGRSPAGQIAMICMTPFPYFLEDELDLGWIPAGLFLLIVVTLSFNAIVGARSRELGSQDMASTDS
jgi:hypothetical protein